MALDDQDVFELIAAERARQDDKYGGPPHDDEHAIDDWLRFINVRVFRLENDFGTTRDNFVQIAALAVAAVESLDRKAEHDVQDRNEGEESPP